MLRKARALRESLGLSLLDVAKGLTKLTPQSLARFETGRHLLRYDTLKELAGFYAERSGHSIDIDNDLVAPEHPEVVSAR